MFKTNSSAVCAASLQCSACSLSAVQCVQPHYNLICAPTCTTVNNKSAYMTLKAFNSTYYPFAPYKVRHTASVASDNVRLASNSAGEGSRMLPVPLACAVQCSGVQCSAVQCAVVQCRGEGVLGCCPCRRPMQCSAVQCSAVQCRAV